MSKVRVGESIVCKISALIHHFGGEAANTQTEHQLHPRSRRAIEVMEDFIALDWVQEVTEVSSARRATLRAFCLTEQGLGAIRLEIARQREASLRRQREVDSEQRPNTLLGQLAQLV